VLEVAREAVEEPARAAMAVQPAPKEAKAEMGAAAAVGEEAEAPVGQAEEAVAAPEGTSSCSPRHQPS
jgi:hypothetical protein